MTTEPKMYIPPDAKTDVAPHWRQPLVDHIDNEIASIKQKMKKGNPTEWQPNLDLMNKERANQIQQMKQDK